MGKKERREEIDQAAKDANERLKPEAAKKFKILRIGNSLRVVKKPPAQSP